MTTSSWGPVRRVGFRFAFLLLVFILAQTFLGLVPKSKWLVELWNQPGYWGVRWLSESVLGIADPSHEFNGSGDGTFDYVWFLLVFLVAALGTIVWSIADRRRTSYPRIAAASWVVLRYALVYAMLSYGCAKILKSQFPDLNPYRLAETVGDLSPMGLLWTFMGYSTPYTVFAGLLEAIGGALLLWRRTATAGALLIAIVMANIVMLNLCYDVPVKLGSMTYLVMTIAVAAPRAHSLIAALLGRAVSEVPPRARASPRWERLRLIAKLVFVGLVAWNLYAEFSTKPNRNAHVHELYGVWIVDAFTLDGAERPPAVSDASRWHKIALNPRGFWIFSMTGDREGLSLTVDASDRTLTVSLNDSALDKDRKKDKDGKDDKEVWHYARPAAERIEIDGAHRGKRFHLAAHLAPPTLLMTRGFHWINDAPFNR